MNFGLLNLFANNYRSQYLNLLTDINNRYSQPKTSSTIPAPETTSYIPVTPADSYIPTPEALQKAAQAEQDKPAATDSNETNNQPETEETNTPAAVPVNRDGTYYYERRARLDYKMELKFNLGAFTQTIQHLAEGDVQSIEQLAQAGFGLNADLDFKGSQKIMTNQSASEETNTTMNRSMSRTSLADMFSMQSKNFALQSFYKEATQIGRSSKVINAGNHRIAINKIALRFSMDNRFDLSFMNRFNVQTKQMADSAPEVVNNYIDSAGNVAEGGTVEMMATFFDAVENYLDSAEAEISSKANEFFDMATSELGFSGSLVDFAKDKLSGTIDKFFARVDTAIEDIKSRFVPNTELNLSQNSNGLNDYSNPALLNQTDHLATA